MYDELKADLLENGLIPMAEYEWATRPAGDWGVFQQDFEADADEGDDCRHGIAMEGSADLYTKGRKPLIWAAIEGILTRHCGTCWRLNLETVDSETKLLHREYVFQTEE